MFFKQDSALIGLLIGVIIPIIFYFLQDFLIPIILGHGFEIQSMQLFAIVSNLGFFRYYIMNLNFEKTAKGIFFSTFIYALIWIYINKGNIF